MNENNVIWKNSIHAKKSYPSLDQDIEVNVVIIGAGITGITAAYQLSKAGKKVGLIEAKEIGSGTTGFSSANLYLPTQTPYHILKRKHGKNAVKLVHRSRETAINFIENITAKYNIPCHFMRRPMYLFSEDHTQNTFLEKELKIFDSIGVEAEYTQNFPLRVPFQKAIKIAHQARFNPLQYVLSLSDVLVSRGCMIFEHTPVIQIERLHCSVMVTTALGKKIRAQKAIIATHIPIGIHHTQFLAYPYRSYVLAAKLKDENYPNGNFWRSGTPHFAISTHNIFSEQLDYLFIAGNHHKTGEKTLGFDILEKYLRKNFPVSSIEYRWSAQHYQPADGLPYIGGSNNIYIATGFSADGLTYGTAAGLGLADLILGKQNSWVELFNPNRITPLSSGAKFTKENSNVLCKYLSDYPGNTDIKNSEQIKPGEGKIIEIDNEKCAAYRDEHNKLYVVSAVCTHMKCIVKWNDSERSWDCPCHGSRFSIDGDILEGPAVLPLPKREG